LFVIYLAAAAAVAVDACSCMPETAEQVFSKADWVSRVLVEKSVRVPKYNITRTGWNFQPWNTQIIYAVRHIDVYKSRNSTLPTQIRTAADSAMCGVSLRVGQHLFLAGTFSSNFFEL
ncbi:hypothetical protein PMAYCL1PPCAC_26824, partial [Pristionchus mayeri]